MLNVFGRKEAQSCDNVSRRAFLKAGGMAAGGLSLAQLLNIEAKAATGRSNKAIINIYLPGGPSHIDTFDMKPDASSEVRGELRPIKTNVPGMEICELFPRLAKMADKFAIIRSIYDSAGDHDCFQCMTGRTKKGLVPPGGWPSYGSWISKLQGSNPGIPANVSLMYPTGERRWGEPGTGGFIGAAHSPMALVSKDPNAKAQNMTLDGISLERLRDRVSLRSALDAFKRETDNSGVMEGLDTFHQQAVDLLTGGGVARALDISDEDPRVLERYGPNDPKFRRDGAPRMVSNFLLARRLVEAGARVVSLNYSRWDWHGGDGMNFIESRAEFPYLDLGVSALLTDLHERGMDKDVSVVVWGEFGRTPKINNMNSRDHWPKASFALLAGVGMRTGQVIGATDRIGGEVTDRPVKFQEVFATLYHNMGINLSEATVLDTQGRPQYLVEPGVAPIKELI